MWVYDCNHKISQNHTIHDHWPKLVGLNRPHQRPKVVEPESLHCPWYWSELNFVDDLVQVISGIWKLHLFTHVEPCCLMIQRCISSSFRVWRCFIRFRQQVRGYHGTAKLKAWKPSHHLSPAFLPHYKYQGQEFPVLPSKQRLQDRTWHGTNRLACASKVLRLRTQIEAN